MAIPQGRLSTEVVPGIILPPDSRQFYALVNYEKGPIAIEDTSEGLLYQDWTLHWDKDTDIVWLTPETVGEPVAFQTIADVKYITFTFDQNARVSLSYSTSVSSFLFWYDTALGTTVTTDIGADVRTPTLFLDDKRSTQFTSNDMMLWYLKSEGGGTYQLIQLLQRERFLTEHVEATGIKEKYIFNVGMSDELRIEFSLSIIPPRSE